MNSFKFRLQSSKQHLNITLSQCYNKVNYETFRKQKFNIKFKLKNYQPIEFSIQEITNILSLFILKSIITIIEVRSLLTIYNLN